MEDYEIILRGIIAFSQRLSRRDYYDLFNYVEYGEMLREIVRNINFFQRLAPTIGKRLCDESLSLAETDVSDADFENVEMLFHFEEEKKSTLF